MMETELLHRTNHAAESASETPSKTHRDFFPRRKAPRISSRELSQAPGSPESPYPRFQPRVCFLADLRPQSSANKEQPPRIWESKNFTRPTALGWPSSDDLTIRSEARAHFKKRLMLSRSMMP